MFEAAGADARGIVVVAIPHRISGQLRGKTVTKLLHAAKLQIELPAVLTDVERAPGIVGTGRDVQVGHEGEGGAGVVHQPDRGGQNGVAQPLAESRRAPPRSRYKDVRRASAPAARP